MTNGTPKQPETPNTLEQLIDAEKKGFYTGATARKAQTILAKTEVIDTHLLIAGDFLENTGGAMDEIRKILEEEFDLDGKDFQERRAKQNEELHQDLVDHTYRAYHEFLSSIAAIIDQLEGEAIDKEKVAAAIIKYCKGQPVNSIFRWMADSSRANAAIKSMVENGIKQENRNELIEAIQKAKTESTAPFKDFTEDKIDPLLRTIGVLRETKGTKKELKEQLKKELKDVPPREKVLAIFADHRELLTLDGKERGLEVRIAGKRIELQGSDLADETTPKMQEISALYGSGARIVFVAYLTK